MQVACCGMEEGRIAARAAERSDAPFHCPECRAVVTLHKGPIKIPHFAHKPPVLCEYGAGETDAHRECKTALFDALQAAGVPCELEKPMDGVRPDIFFLWNNKIPCAVEAQRSNLSVETLARRTLRYRALGVHVLWLALFTEALQEQFYSPRPWEKWLHTAYLGRVYYWRSQVTALQIQPVRFEPFRQQREYHSWYVANDGEPRLSGGYAQVSKRYKKPILGPECHLLADFRPVFKPAWEQGNPPMPSRRLFMDAKPRF